MGGEDLDLQWDVDMIDGGTTSPKVEFEPVSLCAISLQPLFCVLKVRNIPIAACECWLCVTL